MVGGRRREARAPGGQRKVAVIPASRLHRKRRLAALLVVGALAVFWAIPSNVPELVAEQKDVLLGRYALGQFVARALATLLLAPLAAVLASRVPLDRKLAGTTALVVFSTLLAWSVMSLVARAGTQPRYVEQAVSAGPDAPHPRRERAQRPREGRAQPAQRTERPQLAAPRVGDTRTRQPNRRWEIVRRDAPSPARSYPDLPAGFPTATVTLTTDARGLRNLDARDRYDVVVAGDSFAEGSMVSDDETWPQRLAQRSGLSVYNVAVSGAEPQHYLNNFLAFGVEREPRVAIFMVYEGNDFKARSPARPLRAAGVGSFFGSIFDESPLRARLSAWLVSTLGPVRAHAPLPPHPGLAWMPAAVRSPDGREHHYAFEPKRMMRLYWTPEDFARAPEWTTNARIFEEVVAAARSRGVRLIFSWAPSAPHVVLPLLRGRVPAEQLRAFAAFDEDDLPPAPEFERELFARLDSVESVFREFCARHGVEFVSPTRALRERMAAGVPVYFTYDQHWTRLGHEVVAEVLAAHLAGAHPAARP